MPYHYFGGYLMNTYTIYLGAHPIACVSDTERAYACFEAAKTIAEMSDRTASLVWDETGEEVASYDPGLGEDEPSCACEAMNCGYWWQDADEDYPRCHFEGDVAPCEEDDYYEDDDDLECGFDPYCGCYTDDC